MNIVVSRLALYPQTEPRGFAVAFTVTTEGGRVFVQDCCVEFDMLAENPSDQEIIGAAWNVLKTTIAERCEALDKVSPVLGKSWTPPVVLTTEPDPVTP